METQPVPPQHSPVGASPKTSDLAIGSLVCGLLGFLWLPALIGVILGIMAIR